MTGAEMKAWRTSRSKSQDAAAAELGIAPKSLRAYEAADKVPLVVVLAICGINAGWTGEERAIHL